MKDRKYIKLQLNQTTEGQDAKNPLFSEMRLF